MGLTYDELLLQTRYSTVRPSDANLNSRFSRNVRLLIPIVSSAMDKVTEAPMAIAMAKAGGLGIIHKNMSVEAQAEEVQRVKLHLGGKVEKPKSMLGSKTLAEVAAYKAERNFGFDSFPVVDKDGVFVGMLTKRDVDSAKTAGQLVKEVMTPASAVIAGKPGTTKEQALEMMQTNKVSIIPLIDNDGKVDGMYTRTDLDRFMSDTATYNTDSKGRLLVGAAVGADELTMKRAEALVLVGCDVLILDTAHGATENVIETIKKLKAAHPTIDVVAGNVSNGDCAKLLADAGADGILVGQGPGSICTTREVAAIGRAQATAVFWCVYALRDTDIPVCADGGVKLPGHIARALALGAESVMLGGLLAGTKESPGKIVNDGGKRYKEYRGMGSRGAMLDNQASRARYGQGDVALDKLVPEGVEDYVEYKGPLIDVLTQLTGGVRSSMGYLGAPDLSTFRAVAEVERVTNVGARESGASGLVNHQ